MSSESIVKTNPPELHVPVDNLYTHVVSARAGWVHRIGGQVPVDQAGGNVAPGDMAAQIREVYRQVTIALAAAGCTWAEVIHIYTFTTDMDSYLASLEMVAELREFQPLDRRTSRTNCRNILRVGGTYKQICALRDHLLKPCGCLLKTFRIINSAMFWPCMFGILEIGHFR